MNMSYLENSFKIDSVMSKSCKEKLKGAAAAKSVTGLQEILLQNCQPTIWQIDDYNNTPVHYLLSQGCFCEQCVEKGEQCLDLLLGSDGEPELANHPNGDGKTPMHLVVTNRIPIRMVRALVRNGGTIVDPGPVNEPEKGGIKDPELARALINEYPEVLEVLFDHGVKLIEKPTESGIGMYEIELDWRCLVYSKDALKKPPPGGFFCTNNATLEYQWQESKFLYEIVRDQRWEIESLLLKHPLVQSFLHYTEPESIWKRMYKATLSLALAFHFSFVWVFYVWYCSWNGTEYCDVKDNEWTTSTILAWFSAVLSVWPIILEIRKFRVFGPKHYFKELWPGMIVAANAVLIWVTVWSVVRQDRYSQILWQHNWAAVSAVCCSITFMGQLATASRRVATLLNMLLKVSERIVTTMLLMAPVYYGFLLAFRILITDSTVTWFKLVTMIVNGAEYEDLLDRERGNLYEAVSYAVLAAFIIIMIIVVLNFLVGIAVSDVQELATRAETKNLSSAVLGRYLYNCILPFQRTNYWKHANELKDAYVKKPYVCNIGSLNVKENTSSSLPQNIRFQLVNVARKNCKSATVLPSATEYAQPPLKNVHAQVQVPYYYPDEIPTNWQNRRINTAAYKVFK